MLHIYTVGIVVHIPSDIHFSFSLWIVFWDLADNSSFVTLVVVSNWSFESGVMLTNFLADCYVRSDTFGFRHWIPSALQFFLCVNYNEAATDADHWIWNLKITLSLRIAANTLMLFAQRCNYQFFGFLLCCFWPSYVLWFPLFSILQPISSLSSLMLWHIFSPVTFCCGKILHHQLSVKSVQINLTQPDDFQKLKLLAFKKQRRVIWVIYRIWGNISAFCLKGNLRRLGDSCIKLLKKKYCIPKINLIKCQISKLL